jgi:hypothetical protein
MHARLPTRCCELETWNHTASYTGLVHCYIANPLEIYWRKGRSHNVYTHTTQNPPNSLYMSRINGETTTTNQTNVQRPAVTDRPRAAYPCRVAMRSVTVAATAAP